MKVYDEKKNVIYSILKYFKIIISFIFFLCHILVIILLYSLQVILFKPKGLMCKVGNRPLITLVKTKEKKIQLEKTKKKKKKKKQEIPTFVMLTYGQNFFKGDMDVDVRGSYGWAYKVDTWFQ